MDLVCLTLTQVTMNLVYLALAQLPIYYLVCLALTQVISIWCASP